MLTPTGPAGADAQGHRMPIFPVDSRRSPRAISLNKHKQLILNEI
ncbi:hypothetical protein [Burkholderia ubonensis]|nr:hypothetical protein [Burkholderia ubonensis]